MNLDPEWIQHEKTCHHCNGLGIVPDRMAGPDPSTGVCPTLPCPACRITRDVDGSYFILPHSISIPG